ncbi:hypothetical protein ACFFRR_009020 [Megaselia abdita]
MQNQLLQLFLCISISIIDFTLAGKYKSCNHHKLGECPINSLCSQLDLSFGDCKCVSNYAFNEHYKNPNEYCQLAQRLPISSNAIDQKPSSRIVVESRHPDDESSRHLVYGIIISIGTLVTILGIVYAVKSLHLVRKLQAYVISRRRSRPLYTENPLLI